MRSMVAHSTSASSSDERHEAVEQVDRDAALLQPRHRIARRAARGCAERQVEPLPDAVGDGDAVARRGDRTATAARARCGRRLEDLADRLAEAFRRVLHARRQLAEAAVPRRRTRARAVVEEPHGEHASAITIVAMARKKISGE